MLYYRGMPITTSTFSMLSTFLVSCSSLSMTVPAGMTRVLDESIRNDLQRIRDVYFVWLLVCTALVAVGVLLEETESIPLRKTRFNISTGIPVLSYRLISWKKRITTIGWILIVIGVIGEGIFEGCVSKADVLVETFNTTLLVAAQKEAELADVQSASANERAGELENKAADLNQKNLQLEAVIAPRRLSDRQEKALAALTKYSGRIVGIKSYSSDTEGLLLATQIFNALTKARIQIEDNRLTMQPAGSISFGVSVVGSDNDLAEELKRILSMDGNLTRTSSSKSPNRAGVFTSATFGEIRVGTPSAATVMVGWKPIK
jgi:hypothetical protein